MRDPEREGLITPDGHYIVKKLLEANPCKHDTLVSFPSAKGKFCLHCRKYMITNDASK